MRGRLSTVANCLIALLPRRTTDPKIRGRGKQANAHGVEALAPSRRSRLRASEG
jgi:hypothetical protein